MKTRASHIAIFALAMSFPASGQASDLYRGGNWAAMASDRRAQDVGDVITIVVYENTSASNSAGTSSRKQLDVRGGLNVGPIQEDATGGLNGASSGQGSTVREGRMVAQIGGLIERRLPNGDFIIAGEQMMTINGERTRIVIKGQARAADINSANLILSSRLANATIEYDGKGYVSRSAKPGIVTRIFRFFGLA